MNAASGISGLLPLLIPQLRREDSVVLFWVNVRMTLDHLRTQVSPRRRPHAIHDAQSRCKFPQPHILVPRAMPRMARDQSLVLHPTLV
jgi:hypothetical protein